LPEKGCRFERSARDRKKLGWEIGEEGLVLAVQPSMPAPIANEGVDLEGVAAIRIARGVVADPQGVFYHGGLRHEVLMVIGFFG
jgi:hypothetical protein